MIETKLELGVALDCRYRGGQYRLTPNPYDVVVIEAERLLSQGGLVIGSRGYGKSNTLAVLMEGYLKAGIPLHVIDPAGEYFSLKEVSDRVVVVGKSRNSDVDFRLTANDFAEIDRVATLMYTNVFPVVVDVSGYSDIEERRSLTTAWFSRVYNLALQFRYPTAVLIDEAQNFIPQAKKAKGKDLFITLALEGRKSGISVVCSSQRAAMIDKTVISQSDLIFAHRVSSRNDIKVYTDTIPRDANWVKGVVAALSEGQCIAAIRDRVIPCQIHLRESTHVSNTPKLSSLPTHRPSLSDLVASKYD